MITDPTMQRVIDMWYDCINDASEHDLMHLVYAYLDAINDYDYH